MAMIIDLMERLNSSAPALSESYAYKAGTLAGALISIRCTLEAYREHLELLPVGELLESINDVLQRTDTDTREV